MESVTTIAAPTVATAEVPISRFWPHDLILGLLPLILGAQAFFFAAFLPAAWHGIADFRQLYTGGYMIRTGQSKQLYDYDSQERLEEMLVPVGGRYTLPVNHLAFEELLYAPLSLLPYRTAYAIFFVFNCVLLILCLWLLRPRMKILSARWGWFPPFLFAAFYPIMRTLAHGQDSILMLILFVGALSCLDHEKDLAAGLLVGLGIFKFQIVIPIALLFLVWRRWRFGLGFALSSVTAGVVSLWLVGFDGAREYANTMVAMSVHLVSKADMTRYVTMPAAMFNLRGLAYGSLHRVLPPLGIQTIVLLSSVAVLWVAARQRPSLPFAITAASLVSYHFFPHDASILIIPIGAALCSRSVSGGAVAVILLVAPMLDAIGMIVGGVYGYLLAIPLLALFVLSTRSAHRSEEEGQPCAN